MKMENYIWVVVCIFVICVLVWVGHTMGEYGFSGKILKTASALYQLEKKVRYDVCSVMKVTRLPIDIYQPDDNYLLRVMVTSIEPSLSDRMISLDRLDFVTVTDEQWTSIATASLMDLVLNTNNHVTAVRIGCKKCGLLVELEYLTE